MSNLYTFDVGLFAQITVDAPDEAVARKLLDKQLSTAKLHLHDGEIVSVSQCDGAQDVIEIDGDPV